MDGHEGVRKLMFFDQEGRIVQGAVCLHSSFPTCKEYFSTSSSPLMLFIHIAPFTLGTQIIIIPHRSRFLFKTSSSRNTT